MACGCNNGRERFCGWEERERGGGCNNGRNACQHAVNRLIEDFEALEAKMEEIRRDVCRARRACREVEERNDGCGCRCNRGCCR